MTSSLDMIRGRSNVVTLTNKSGGALVAGDVCIIDTSNDEAATTTTSAASVLKVYIAAESIANDATGKFYSAGFCPLVTPSASVTRGRYLFTHTAAKQGAENATYGSGAFGVILKSGTTPSVWLFGTTAQGSGGGVARSGATTDGHLAVWNGSSADSIKDGGVVSAAGLTLLGSAYDASARAYSADNTWEDVVNTSVTFTAAGAENVIVDVDVVWSFTSAAWGHHKIRLLLGSATTGVTPDSWVAWVQNSNPDTTLIHQNHVQFIVSAASGSNTVKLQTFDNGANVNRSFQQTLITVMGQ